MAEKKKKRQGRSIGQRLKRLGCFALFAGCGVCSLFMFSVFYAPDQPRVGAVPTLMQLPSVTPSDAPSDTPIPTDAPTEISTEIPTMTITASATSTQPPTVGPTSTPSATITSTAIFTPSATITSTLMPTVAIFDEAEYVRSLYDGLFIVAGGRDIASIRVADGRSNGGERSIIVAYQTTETTDAGYVEEFIDLFQGIAAVIDANELDVDSISLVAGDVLGNTAGILVTSNEDLMAYHNGQITRQTFMSRLTITTF